MTVTIRYRSSAPCTAWIFALPRSYCQYCQWRHAPRRSGDAPGLALAVPRLRTTSSPPRQDAGVCAALQARPMGWVCYSAMLQPWPARAMRRQALRQVAPSVLPVRVTSDRSTYRPPFGRSEVLGHSRALWHLPRALQSNPAGGTRRVKRRLPVDAAK